MTHTIRGFIIKREFAAGIGLLNREQKGALLEALFADMGEGTMPSLDPVTMAVFAMLLPSVHDAQAAFAKQVETLRNNGKYGRLGGRPRKTSRDTQPCQEPKPVTGSDDSSAFLQTRDGQEKPGTDGQEGNNEQTGEDPDTPSLSDERAAPSGKTSGGRPHNTPEPLSSSPRLAGKSASRRKTSAEPVARRPPTVDEVRAYCDERNNGLSAERFCDYYAAQGWRLSNGQPLRDWHAAVRKWETRESDRRAGNPERLFPNTLTDTERRQAHNNAVCAQVLADLNGGPF